MRSVRSLLLLVALVFFVGVAESKISALVGCVAQGTDCNECMYKEGCGYCGAIGVGICLPGNIDGSDVKTFGQSAECPASLWRFASSPDNINASCTAPARIVFEDLNDNDTHSYSSWTVQGSIQEPEVDALNYKVSTQPLTAAVSDFRRATVLASYGFAQGIDLSAVADSYNLAAAFFSEIVEYDKEGGLECTEIIRTDIADVKVLCPDFDTIKEFSELRNFTDVRSNQYLQSDNKTVYEMTTATLDGIFNLTCVFSNQNVTFNNIVMNPFELYCSVLINWDFTRPEYKLAIQLTAGSIKRDEPEDSVTSVDLGGGAFLAWDNLFDTSLGPGPVETSSFKVLSDSQLSISSVFNGPVVGNFISFAGQNGVSPLTWRFRVGFDPLAARDFVINSAGGLGPSMLVLCGLLTFLAAFLL